MGPNKKRGDPSSRIAPHIHSLCLRTALRAYPEAVIPITYLYSHLDYAFVPNISLDYLARMNQDITSIRSMPPRLLTVLEAAEYLIISERKIRDEIAKGMLGAARIGRRLIIRLRDLDDYVEERLK